ncbi:MAG TPA: putative sulfate exporter family transporter [Polyangiaceae bacterium]|nr:putative sulfate exporter family transporter [Polyangiaceae bacterium]
MRRPQWIPSRADLPGLALVLVLGALALVCARVLPPSPFISDILLALGFGVLVLNTPLRAAIGLTLPAAEREPDRYAAGLRFTGKWVLRLGIILMGLKVQTSFFGGRELFLIGGVALAALPSAFFIAHALGSLLGVRRPMVDLLASGTMICGASAVNAVAPVARAHREEQGIAIGVVFLFSIVALLAFRPLASALGLDSGMAGLWSGLAVNDLSSAIAVGAQMGGHGGVMAAASKSARILLLAPTLIALSLLRREGSPVSVKKSVVDTLPAFILGYIALAALRAVADRVAGGSVVWQTVLATNKLAVDLLMSTVSAGIGLHLALRTLLTSSARAIAVGGGASAWMAGLTLVMIVAASRGSPSAAALAGLLGVVASFVAYRAGTAKGRALRLLRARFASGAPLALYEATNLLDAAEQDGAFDDAFLKQVLAQLHPSIGELIPVRKSPLPKGEGCRWVTYWEGRSGWALVAVCREPGSFTPIHAHPHRLLGKAIEGVLEEVRFSEREDGDVEVASRTVLGHNDLVETNALSTLHIVRVVSSSPAIDIQLRGPEVGKPGRRFRAAEPLDFGALRIGARVHATEEIDDRPGHGGEGAAAGRPVRAVVG